MTESKNRRWILNSRPTGKLTGEEFRWNEAPIPEPSDGQMLIRTLWLSVDPAQRLWMARDSYKPAVPLGEVMQSFAVGQVLESRRPDFKPGDIVRGDFSWQDYVVTDGKGFGGMQKVPPGTPPHLALSLFGVNGLTAYFGMIEIGKIKAGETVVVSGAAGATGSVAGQVAKNQGLPCHRYRGRPGQVRLAGQRSALRRRHRLQKRGRRRSAFGAVPQRDRRVLRQCRRRGPQRSSRSDQRQRAHRAVRLDLEIRRRYAAARARRTIPIWWPGARAWRASPGLIIPRGFPRPSKRWAAGMRMAASSTRRISRIGLENAPKALLRLFAGENFGKQLVKVADAPA